MSFCSFFHRSQPQRVARWANHGHAGRQLRFETFEDRRMLSFTPAGSYGVGLDPKSIVAADFNHDGQLDLATSNTGGTTVSVLLGNANGTFEPAQTSAAGANPFSLAVGDFNADGTLDLAAINGGASGVNVMIGNRDGTFQAPTRVNELGFGVTTESVAAGDFNGDGKMDLVVTSNWRPPNYEVYAQGQADVLLSLGDGSFAAPRTWAPVDRALGAAVVADMNGDLKLDLVTEMPDYSGVLVLLGDGHGNLGGGYGGAFSTNPSAAGDLDDDGDTDIVSAPLWFNFPTTVGVMLGDGEGGISYNPDHIPIGGTTDSAILGDFDRDGSIDIAAAITNGNSVSILRNEGNRTGTFGTPEHFAVGQSSSPTTSGDSNYDGVIDSADYVTWRKSNGTLEGYAAWRANFGQSAPVVIPNAVVTGDFNGDGWLDLATANAQGSVSVLFNDQNWSQVLPTLSVSGAYDITEGNTGTTNATFAVTLSRVSDVDVTVHYDTADVYNSAVAGIDYIAESGTVVIPAGLTSGTFTVAVIGDRLLEPDEYFRIRLSSPTNATILVGEVAGIIVDDEPRISIGDVTVTEGNTGTLNVTLMVSLSASSAVDVTVHYDTADSSALAGSDYTATSGDLVIPAGQTSRTFTVAVLGDRIFESTECFSVSLSAPTNAIILDGYAFVTILNNEPRISINNVSKSEGKGNKTTLFTFTVTLSAADDQPVTMSYRTVDGTATTADSDYIAKTGTLTFAPGETTKTITIEVKADSKKEADETFYLDLFDNSINSVFTKSRGIGTIWNDDK